MTEKSVRHIEVASETARKASLLEEAKRRAEIKTLEQKITDCFLEPGPGRVIVALPDQPISRGVIYIPQGKGPAATVGIVLKVGLNCTMEFWDEHFCAYKILQPGDKVVYGTWTGTLLNFEERPAYRVLADTEILSKLSGETTKLIDVQA